MWLEDCWSCEACWLTAAADVLSEQLFQLSGRWADGLVVTAGWSPRPLAPPAPEEYLSGVHAAGLTGTPEAVGHAAISDLEVAVAAAKAAA